MLISNTNIINAENNIDFEDLFDNHQSVMLIIHPVTGEIYYANQAAVDFYGYPKDQLIGMNIDNINMLTPEEVAAERQRAADEERNFFVFKHRLADGDIRTVHVYSYPVQISGETYLYSFIIDQTVLAATEARNRLLIIGIISLTLVAVITTTTFAIILWNKNQRLKQSKKDEEYFKKILDYVITNSTQAIAVHDKDMNYIYASEQYYKQYRVKDKNIIGKNHYDVFPDIPDKWKDVHQRCLKGESLSSERDYFDREDGSRDYTRWQCKPWYDKDGTVCGIIIYSEVINNQIVTELQLTKTKERMEFVMDNLPIGIAVNSVDPGVEFNYMNDNFPLIYGVTREELEENDNFWEVVYEDEQFREELKTKVLNDIASGDPKRMSWIDVPIKKKGKPTRYISAYATPIANTNLLISTVIDVTERKVKEDEILHVSNHDYLTNIPNRRYYQEMLSKYNNELHHPLGIVYMDMNGLKLFNDAYGHNVGNQALKEIANKLDKLKKKDEFIARIGGDEFAMICPKTTKSKMESRIETIDKAISEIEVRDIKLSLALGYAIKTHSEDSFREVITQAENSMYKNKFLTSKSEKNDAIQSILLTLQNKFKEEKVHSERVGKYCKQIGEALNLNKNDLVELEKAGLYHDIGKISIPDSILKKPGKLTKDEWETMKEHTVNGYQILRAADRYSNIAEYAMSHHERIDGKGYPNGMSGDDIPLFSRIICVVDAYEAMTSDRPYRKAIKKEAAIQELQKHAGTQFDAEIVELFINEVLSN